MMSATALETQTEADAGLEASTGSGLNESDAGCGCHVGRAPTPWAPFLLLMIGWLARHSRGNRAVGRTANEAHSPNGIALGFRLLWGLWRAARGLILAGVHHRWQLRTNPDSRSSFPDRNCESEARSSPSTIRWGRMASSRRTRRTAIASEFLLLELGRFVEAQRTQDKALNEASLYVDRSTPYRAFTEVLFTLGQAEVTKWHVVGCQGQTARDEGLRAAVSGCGEPISEGGSHHHRHEGPSWVAWGGRPLRGGQA